MNSWRYKNWIEICINTKINIKVKISRYKVIINKNKRYINIQRYKYQ